MGPQEVFDGTAIESATTPNFPNLERGGTKILSVQPLNEDSQDAGLDFGTPEQRRTLPAAKGRSNPEPGAAKLRPSAFVPGVLQASRKDQSQSN